MSSVGDLNFASFINQTFSHGSLHINNLHVLLKCLVHKLNLDEIELTIEEGSMKKHSAQSERSVSAENNFENYDQIQNRTDFVLPILPNPEKLNEVLCQETNSNPVVDMMDLLNLTKRVEALEITVQKLTSFYSFKKHQSGEENPKDSKGRESNSNEIEKTILIPSDKQTEETILIPSEKQSEETILNPSYTKTEETSNQVNPSKSFSPDQVSSKSSIHSDPTVNSQKSKDSQKDEEKSEKSIRSRSSLFSRENLKNLVDEQVRLQGSKMMEKITKISKIVCDLQKQVNAQQETVDDLLFATESLDVRIEETINEMKNFNKNIFCLKSDTKTLLSDSKIVEEKLDDLFTKHQIMSNLKANKSYVDELWRQKAFKTDLELCVRRNEFEPLIDILKLKFSLLNDNFEDLSAKTKKSFCCVQALVTESKNNWENNKEAIKFVIDEFKKDITILIHELVKNPSGLAGSKDLDTNLNCLVCKTNVSMVKVVKNIPKLSSVTQKFKRDMVKLYEKQDDNEE